MLLRRLPAAVDGHKKVIGWRGLPLKLCPGNRGHMEQVAPGYRSQLAALASRVAAADVYLKADAT